MLTIFLCVSLLLPLVYTDVKGNIRVLNINTYCALIVEE